MNGCASSHNTATCQPAAVTEGQPDIWSEEDHMKSIPYVPVIGSLMYTMVTTQPYLAHVVGIVCRFMHKPGRAPWNEGKHIFRYLIGTKGYDITFALDERSNLVGYTDSDYGSYLDSQKSTSGYCFKFGHESSRGGRNFKNARPRLL